jgi:hypothetical protein
MKTNYLLIILLWFMVSCTDQIPKEKLSAIENITLGDINNTYFDQFQKLRIPSARFITNPLMLKHEELLDDKNYYFSYYTKMFNFNEFRIPSISLEHIGLITPIPFEGSEKNYALLILLCRTKDPWLAGDAEQHKNEVVEKFIRQEVNIDVIEKIKNMYLTKYGVPSSKITSNANKYYIITHDLLSIQKDNRFSSEILKWNTEYFTVTFFTGIDINGIYNPENGYVESTNSYQSNISNDKADPLKNELKCSAYAYIYYELNAKALKLLKIDLNKI